MKRQFTHLMKKLILVVIVLAIGIALGVYLQKQPGFQKLETKTQTDAGQTDADAKSGMQKVDAVAADVKAGAQKVHDITTNAVGEVKDKLP
jgi:uncharacterized protein HemX